MEKLTVACVQQRMRLPDSVDEYREDLSRFLRAAANKRARLVIFPELAGIMIVPPLLGGRQAGLLKRADRARRQQASFWQRVDGQMADAALRLLQVDLRRLIGGALETVAPTLWTTYLDLFGGLAREFDMTLVAPSAYLPDPLDGVIRNLTAVFGPNGDLLGYQPKGILHAEDQDLAQPGNEWRVIATDVGRIGVMLGNDMLYPEVGRLLAYQGAEILIGQAAATDRSLYEKLRAGMLARMQENQLFGALSFLVGPNEFGRQPERQPFLGKSSVFAPQELTPRSSGILVEMSNTRSEGVLAAVWDFPALQALWESSDTPVRNRFAAEQIAPMLAKLYDQIRQLPRPQERLALPEPAPHTGEPHSLDELPVVASVTARWPLDAADPDESAPAEEDLDLPQEDAGATFLRSALKPADEEGRERDRGETAAEDETQEMDALLQPTDQDPDASEEQ